MTVKAGQQMFTKTTITFLEPTARVPEDGSPAEKKPGTVEDGRLMFSDLHPTK